MSWLAHPFPLPPLSYTATPTPTNKMNLYHGYLGDGLPLCEDLPSWAYLKKGATFVYLGNSKEPLDHYHYNFYDAAQYNPNRFIPSRGITTQKRSLRFYISRGWGNWLSPSLRTLALAT